MKIETECPCCGQPVEAYPLDRIAAIVTPVMGEIVARLMTCPGEFVPVEELVRWTYRRDPNGGPDAGKATIMNVINHNRRRLNALGWDVRGRMGRIGGLRIVVFNKEEKS